MPNTELHEKWRAIVNEFRASGLTGDGARRESQASVLLG